MKKIISLIVVITLSIGILTSCSKFNKDPHQYAEDLETKGFYVELFENPEHSLSLDYFDIYEIAEDFEVTDHVSWIDYVLFCENEEEGYFFYCYNVDSAKRLEKDLNKLTEKYRGYAEAIIKREGKIVYFGLEENWLEL